MDVYLIKMGWWLRAESNHRHTDFQSVALPTELLSQMAVQTGLEPAISCVTGRHVNHYTTGPFGCGGGIRTHGLRVMSPTSYQTAPPRDIRLKCKWRRKRDSNPRDGFPPCRFSRPIPSAGLGYSSV